MTKEERIEQIMRNFASDFVHEGIALQESWFGEVAEEIVKLFAIPIVTNCENYGELFFEWLRSNSELDMYEAMLDRSTDYTDEEWRQRACADIDKLKLRYRQQLKT